MFREWPYLYDGDEEYERRYLATYAASPGAAMVLAIAPGEEVVGVSTCQPMTEAAEPVRTAFERRGLDPRRFCYFGESVLLPAWRGRGAGVRFFEMREAYARDTLGLDYAAFCAVQRDPDDPRRPKDYVPLDAFWRRRGYTFYPDLRCVFHWREIGQTEETPHELAFWIKPLAEGVPLP
ncbi:GNAT family N-acetyltransferase [Caldovatus sp. SYSU G05006]|uniref:GNAT family N-acetyltransferase n=1 Tax=Caldovatus aquaticus TaxID=2865671 RepID=A0ABS7F1F6_9PROT|nr:GNAT family N-acetyltransferase [Caldovatus aquaticus]